MNASEGNENRAHNRNMVGQKSDLADEDKLLVENFPMS